MSRIVFQNANLLDGNNSAQSAKTVVVEGDRVTAVADDGSVEAREGDRVVDLAGRSLMPGMHTCHFHAVYDQYELVAFPLGIDKPPGYLMLRAAQSVQKALMAGFTSIVGGAVSDDLDAQLKMGIEDGIVQGPRIMAGSRGFGTRGGYVDLSPWWWGLQNDGASALASGPEGLRAAVREEIKRGAEIIKLYVTGGHGDPQRDVSEFAPDELEAIVRAVHERGRKVRAHVCWKPEILRCIELGVDVIDHGDAIDAECIDAMVEAGTVFVPSALYLQKLLDCEALRVPGTEEMIATTQRELDNLLARVPEADRAGVKIVLGDDYGVSLMPHGTYAEELEFYVKRAGVSPLDVIRWATVNGAELAGRSDDLGAVEEGKLADLLVVDGDPSVDIGILRDADRLLAIMKGGELVKDALP